VKEEEEEEEEEEDNVYRYIMSERWRRRITCPGTL